MEKHTKKKVTKNKGIKNSICGRRIGYGDSSWETSLFCTRGSRSWYCLHLQMKEEGSQNLQETEPKLLPLLPQVKMQPAMQNFLYLMLVAVEGVIYFFVISSVKQIKGRWFMNSQTVGGRSGKFKVTVKERTSAKVKVNTRLKVTSKINLVALLDLGLKTILVHSDLNNC